MTSETTTYLKSFGDDYLTRSLLACAFISAAVFVGLLGPFLVEDRLVDGHNVWLKPQKFTISLFVHFMTVAFAAQFLSSKVRTQRILTISVAATMVAHVFEGLWVIYQAGRSRRSHFNFDSNIEALMYAGMGIAVLFLVWIAFLVGWKIWRNVENKSGLAWGFVIGLMGGTLVTLALAGYMSMSGWRQVGEHPMGGAEVPFFGWSRVVGDLRPAHFVALHMMQSLPIIGWIADLRNWNGKRVVMIAAVLQTILAAALFYQALLGHPIWPV